MTCDRYILYYLVDLVVNMGHLHYNTLYTDSFLSSISRAYDLDVHASASHPPLTP